MEQTGAVLVVDDDEFLRDVLGLQLQALGWTNILYADSGDQALTLFDQHRNAIAVIVTDLSMPDMDGLVLMRHLARRQAGTALILVSGLNSEILTAAAHLADAHGFRLLGVLPKPSTADDLSQLLSGLERVRRTPGTADQELLTPERLRQALSAVEVIPWYQPQLDVQSGRPIGVEALARWLLPGRPGISPGHFIPAMEAAGLADDLLFAIAAQVVGHMQRWRAQGISVVAAINVSMDSALNLEMPERLFQMVQGAGLHPRDFIVEVTESRLMVERSLAMESLTRLSLMGFTLSIDDFGTGYSSLVQLIDLPFKELKIDGSFVQRASLEHKARGVLRISSVLGGNLGMAVIAEGVETGEQMEFVRECGCSAVQGYYFARPMPFDECSRWLTERLQ